jgi:hypothetical protein
MVYTINYRTVNRENVGQAHWVVPLLMLVFVAVCVFDPADQILGGKVIVFCALWGVTIFKILVMRDDLFLPLDSVLYVGTFIAIPLLSIGWYFVIDGQQPFEGFGLLKAYLFVSFAIVLVLNRIDLVPPLSAALTVLACLVIAVFGAIELEPDLYETLSPLGVSSGLLILDKRSFGDFELIQVYFVTSPMLAISIAYYFDRLMVGPGGGRRFLFLALTAVNIAGMFLAGTRNNILVSLLLPFVLWPLYAKRVVVASLCSFAVLAALAWPFVDWLSAFFDPSEGGNSIKLVEMNDYFRIFGDTLTLLFGQGLGAYENWTDGIHQFYFVTELTYLEMVRNFGLIGALVMLGLLLFPIANAFFVQTSKRERSLAVAYLLYLVMCATNPNLFSSMGMLILAVLVANIFQSRDREFAAAQREIA